MADLMRPWRLRVAFAFGDERLATHVCEAVGGEAELVYTAPVGEFDVSRLAEDHVAAVLVNVDAGGAAELLEARLGDSAVRVVFNDPEISATLEGWARARWLRHLMAKLRGDTDVDPPRPNAEGARAQASASSVPSQPVEAAAGERVGGTVAASRDTGAELAMSLAERGDQPAERGPAPPTEIQATLDEIPLTPAIARASGSQAMASAAVSSPMNAAGQPVERDITPDDPAEAPLDIDTAALSAMIDARLAEPSTAPAADDLAATWATPLEAPTADSVTTPDEDAADGAVAAPSSPVADVDTTSGEVVVSGDPADADILASLPSLDEWELVDPGAELPATGHAPGGPSAAPTVPDGLDAGLELLPQDGMALAHDKDELIKRWLHESEGGQHAGGGNA